MRRAITRDPSPSSNRKRARRYRRLVPFYRSFGVLKPKLKNGEKNGSYNFVGLDVDDQSFHGYAVCAAGELNFEFSCKPNVGSLTKKLEKISPDKSLFRICYEATFLGFSLSRALLKYGYQCAVIAPSLIPEVNGPRVKTDRLDSRKLAEFHRSGLLTVVSEPSEEDEQVRDLVRSRVFLNRQILSFKKHALSICRRRESIIGKP